MFMRLTRCRAAELEQRAAVMKAQREAREIEAGQRAAEIAELTGRLDKCRYELSVARRQVGSTCATNHWAQNLYSFLPCSRGHARAAGLVGGISFRTPECGGAGCILE